MTESIIGYSSDELVLALADIEESVEPGGWAKVELYTGLLPSQQALDDMFLAIVQTGHTITQPTAQMVDGVPMTTFNIQRDLPFEKYQWALLIPLILPVFFGGLAVFAVSKLKSIVSTLMPVIIVGGVILLGTLIILAKPASNVATEYLKSGAPKPKLLASTIKDHGRVDYMSRSKKWRAIGYQGKRELPLGDFESKVEAETMLRDYVDKRNFAPSTIMLLEATPELDYLPATDLNVKYVRANIPGRNHPVWIIESTLPKRPGATLVEPKEEKTLSEITGVDLVHIQEMLNAFTIPELDNMFGSYYSFDAAIPVEERPHYWRDKTKEANIDEILNWASHHPKAAGLPLMIEKLEKAGQVKMQTPTSGPVPGTYSIKWEDFTKLPSYATIARAVNYPNDYNRKCSPVTKDGHVSVDAIYNMSAWANWKSSSLGDRERGEANAIDALPLGALMKLNRGRRHDQPALFPDKETPFLPSVTPAYFKTNPPSPIFDDDGLKYGIHNQFETRQEADEEVRDLKHGGEHQKGDKFIVKPWEGGYVIYAHWEGQLQPSTEIKWEKVGAVTTGGKGYFFVAFTPKGKFTVVWSRLEEKWLAQGDQAPPLGECPTYGRFDTPEEGKKFLENKISMMPCTMQSSTKPQMVGTVWTARAKLWDKNKSFIATCMDTPNAIAKAFMEEPKAMWVSEAYETKLQPRSKYEDRMESWNEAQSMLNYQTCNMEAETSDDKYSIANIQAEYEAMKAGEPAINPVIVNVLQDAEIRVKKIAVSTDIKFSDKNVIEWAFDVLHDLNHKWMAATISDDDPDYEVVKMYCQKCGKEVPSPKEFRSGEAMRNFMVTGWCQDCQDEWALEEMKKKGYNQSNYSADNETIPEALMKSAAEEMLAGDAYRVRADMAEEKGDSKSAALWRHIADEECCSGGSHFLEFNDRYNEIAEGGVPKEKPYRTRKGFWYDKDNIPMRDGTGKQKRNPPREMAADTEEMVLSFSDYKEGMLRWVARYPDKTMTVMVKDFNNNQPVPEEAMKAAFRYSKATINNIVTNHDLVYAGNDDNSIWFLTTIGNLPVEVQISDIENMKERRLEDIFNGAAAVIHEQLVPQRSTMTEKPEEMPERKDLPRQFIADSAEYMADTITKSGWREKIDDAFQSAVERLKK